MARVLSPPETENDERGTDGSGDITQATPVVPGTEWLVQRMHRPLETLWAHGFRFLFVLDAVGLFGVMVVINLVRFGTDWPTYPLSHYFVGFSIATGIHLVINYFVGLYEREPRLGWRPWLPRTLLATAIGVGVQALAFVVLDRYLMPRLNLAVFLVVASMVLAGNRRLSRFLAVRRQGPPRVVLVGTAADVTMAARHLADSDRDAVVVGSVPTPARAGRRRSARPTPPTCCCSTSTPSARSSPSRCRRLERDGIGFLQRVSARETLLGLQSVRQVAGMPFVRLRVHTVPSYKLAFKRLFDLVLVIVTAPLWLLVLGGLALYVLVRAGRPIFYRQERVGRDGELFRVVKFRTMMPDAEQRGPQLALKQRSPRRPRPRVDALDPRRRAAAAAQRADRPDVARRAAAGAARAGRARSRPGCPATCAATSCRPDSPAWPRSTATTPPTPSTSSATTCSTSSTGRRSSTSRSSLRTVWVVLSRRG